MADKKDNKYIEAVGRRKTSVARVRITPAAKSSYEINGRNQVYERPANDHNGQNVKIYYLQKTPARVFFVTP
jgi:ribosomal protein S9